MKEREATTLPTGRLDLSRVVLTREQFEEKFTTTYERDLFSYDDDSFLMQRLMEDNRILRRAPQLKEEVGVALIADDDEAILEVVDDITQAWQEFSPKPQRPINTILSYL